MKVDIIYMFPSENLYAGLAISRKSDRTNKFGVTAGFDVASWLIGKKKGWWNNPLKVFDNYF